MMKNNRISILPLGDSITNGHNYPGGYRIELFRLLGLSNIKTSFLGSEVNGPEELPEKKHEGHSGWTIEGINSRIKHWLKNNEPDIILLLIGTNNIAQLQPAEIAIKKLNILINNICQLKPDSKILIASIPPINNTTMNKMVDDYNNRIKLLCTNLRQNNRRITFVDVHSNLSFNDLFDGAHPNKQGHKKIAAKWYEAILKLPRFSNYKYGF